jgi:hypothetical protein
MRMGPTRAQGRGERRRGEGEPRERSHRQSDYPGAARAATLRESF